MRTTIFIAALFSLVIALSPMMTAAQPIPHSGGVMASGEMSHEQIHQRLMDRIDAAQHLTTQERTTMHENLGMCAQLDLSVSELDAIFPGSVAGKELSGQAMIRIQNRVIAAARDGIPVGLVVAKIHEGRTKGVAEPMLEQVCARMEDHLRAADRVMAHAHEMGLEPAEDRIREHHLERDIAQQMWRGMREEDYEHLFERARQRLHDGDCNMEDVVSAGEIATRLHGQGVEHERALKVSGDALDRGYRSHDMRYLQFMVTARRRTGPPDDFVGDLEHCLALGMGLDEMHQHMMQHGWMGPGDMWGPGGYHPIDDMGHGPGHNGMMDGGQDDGMGDGHGGGGHDGKM